MVAPRFRSRSFRIVKVRTPGGRAVVHHERRKPGKPQCGMCGDVLKGTARGISAAVGKLSRSERRPERPYGGVLCSKCMRKVMIERAKKMAV